jgi:hypothetical protein
VNAWRIRLCSVYVVCGDDMSRVLAVTGRTAVFYGFTWRWLALGFWRLSDA